MSLHRYMVLQCLGWASIAFVFNKHIFTIKVVSGRSMQPTFNPHTSTWRDVLVLDRTVTGRGYHCTRGDIVALRSPDNPDELLVKRVIALGGDQVQTLHPYPDHVIKVPEGCMWVEGDERFHTRDSNHFGPVPLALLDSKAEFILWPPSRFGSIYTPLARARAPVPILSLDWRKENDAIERERWRNKRVQIRHEPDSKG